MTKERPSGIDEINDLIIPSPRGPVYSTGDIQNPGMSQSNVFELKSAAQVLFYFGAAMHTSNSQVVGLQLHICRDGEPSRQISEAQHAHGGWNLTIYAISSLYLPAGRYTWRAEFRFAPGAEFDTYQMKWTISEDSSPIDFTLWGTWNLWTTISSQKEKRVTARAALEVYNESIGIATCILSSEGAQLGKTGPNQGSPNAIARIDSIVVTPSKEYRIDANFGLSVGDQRYSNMRLVE